MPKRFTDTNKWRKPFIRSLQAPYKLFWFYLLDDCDHAGIWIVDWDVVPIRIGEEIDKDEALKLLENKIEIFDNGERWFIPDFIEFQYGELNSSNRAHNSVIKTLKKYNLLKSEMVLTSPLKGAKEKDTEKDMDKDQEKEKECLAKDSDLTVEKIQAEFKKTKALKIADPDYYFNRVIEWSNSNSAKREDWLSQTVGIARSDLAQKKLVVLTNVYVK